MVSLVDASWLWRGPFESLWTGMKNMRLWWVCWSAGFRFCWWLTRDGSSTDRMTEEEAFSKWLGPFDNLLVVSDGKGLPNSLTRFSQRWCSSSGYCDIGSCSSSKRSLGHLETTGETRQRCEVFQRVSLDQLNRWMTTGKMAIMAEAVQSLRWRHFLGMFILAVAYASTSWWYQYVQPIGIGPPGNSWDARAKFWPYYCLGACPGFKSRALPPRIF